MNEPAKILPRVIRMAEAPKYCGVSVRVFDSDFRPHLNEAVFGKQGVGFDRIEVDSFITWYFKRHGKRKAQGSKSWQKEEQPKSKVSTSKTVNLSLIKSTKKSGFLNDLANAANKKRKIP